MGFLRNQITIEEENTHPVLSQEGGTVTIPFKAKDEWTARVTEENETWISGTPSFMPIGMLSKIQSLQYILVNIRYLLDIV